MAEKARLQIKTVTDPEKWVDVGTGTGALNVPVVDRVANSLVPSTYDYIVLSDYDGANAGTVIYKVGGASGTVVATLTLTYDGSGNLLTVTKT